MGASLAGVTESQVFPFLSEKGNHKDLSQGILAILRPDGTYVQIQYVMKLRKVRNK